MIDASVVDDALKLPLCALKLLGRFFVYSLIHNIASNVQFSLIFVVSSMSLLCEVRPAGRRVSIHSRLDPMRHIDVD